MYSVLFGNNSSYAVILSALFFMTACVDEKFQTSSEAGARPPSRLPDPVMVSSLPDPIMVDGRTPASGKSQSDFQPRADSVFGKVCDEDIRLLSISIANSVLLNVSKDAGIGSEYARSEIAKILYFLIADFGKPLVPTGNISISVYRGTDGHAFVSNHKNGRKTIKIDPINFAELQRMYITHEFFHGFYQPNSWISSNPVKEAEKWAVYEQLRYNMREKNNKEILGFVKENYSSYSDSYLDSIEKFPWGAFSASIQQSIYYRAAKELFSSNHPDNVSLYFSKMPQKKAISPCRSPRPFQKMSPR